MRDFRAQANLALEELARSELILHAMPETLELVRHLDTEFHSAMFLKKYWRNVAYLCEVPLKRDDCELEIFLKMRTEKQYLQKYAQMRMGRVAPSQGVEPDHARVIRFCAAMSMAGVQ